MKITPRKQSGVSMTLTNHKHGGGLEIIFRRDVDNVGVFLTLTAAERGRCGRMVLRRLTEEPWRLNTGRVSPKDHPGVSLDFGHRYGVAGLFISAKRFLGDVDGVMVYLSAKEAERLVGAF